MPDKLPIPIIILNWNNINDTLECLETVLQMSYNNYIVYLVDNNSRDGSRATLVENYSNHPKIKLIFNEENLGFTKGNNVIIRQILFQPIVPKYIVLLNNDTAVTPDWLNNLLSSAATNKADMVSSKMIDYYEREKMDNAGHLMLNTGEVLPIGHGHPISEYMEGFENMGACAGAALYATKMLQDIGIFDEHFTTGYEDAELGVRAVVSGYKCWYEPSAIVYHKMGQSVKKIFDYSYSLSIQKHILYSYFKLMPRIVLLLTLPALIIKYLSMFVILLLFWRTKHLKVFFYAVKETLTQNLSIISKKRADFFAQRDHIEGVSLRRKQTSFLWFDIKRFYRLFILNKLSSLDVYGKV